MTSTQKSGYHELTETVSEYKWTLYNFSSFNQQTEQYITSKEFLSNDTMWFIRLYPNGKDLESKGYISIFLFRILSPFDCIEVYTEFTMSNNYNKIYKTLKSNIIYGSDKPLSNGQGYSKFLDRTLLDDLKDKNDILIVTVKIIYSKSTVQLERNCLNLQQDFRSLLTTKEITDVILVSRDKTEYKAHKAILACRSKVFSAMFRHNTKESQDNIVNIEDVDGRTLNAMLCFVYTGKLDEDIKDISKKLLIVADKYELNDLRMMCVNYLLANMNCDNVLDLIKIADTYSIKEMGLKAKEYFVQNYKEILSVDKREKLKILPRDILEDLLCNQASI